MTELGVLLDRIAIFSDHNGLMEFCVAEAKNRLSELLRSVDRGDKVDITLSGRPVTQIVPIPPTRPVVKFGTMSGRIRLAKGWDKPIDEAQFLKGDF